MLDIKLVEPEVDADDVETGVDGLVELLALVATFVAAIGENLLACGAFFKTVVVVVTGVVVVVVEAVVGVEVVDLEIGVVMASEVVVVVVVVDIVGLVEADVEIVVVEIGVVEVEVVDVVFEIGIFWVECKAGVVVAVGEAIVVVVDLEIGEVMASEVVIVVVDIVVVDGEVVVGVVEVVVVVGKAGLGAFVGEVFLKAHTSGFVTVDLVFKIAHFSGCFFIVVLPVVKVESAFFE